MHLGGGVPLARPVEREVGKLAGWVIAVVRGVEGVGFGLIPRDGGSRKGWAWD